MIRNLRHLFQYYPHSWIALTLTCAISTVTPSVTAAAPATAGNGAGDRTDDAKTETTSVSGRLTERGTKKPLEEAAIFLLPEKLKATTEADGTFSFTAVPVGDHTVIVNRSGYRKLEEPFVVLAAEKKPAPTFPRTRILRR